MMPVVRKRKKQAPRGSSFEKPLFTGKARPRYGIPDTNVFEAAKARINWLFDEFDGHVSVSNSGGKDSTVLLELTAMVAKERGEPPLRVIWLDQECEYQATVDYQRYLLNERDDIDFQWFQIPYRLYNATNHENPWLNVWGEGEEWVREKEPGAIHEAPNLRMPKTGAIPDRFKDVLLCINQQQGGAILTGMRGEESPARRVFMTSKPMYKWVTWGSEGTWARDENFELERDEDGELLGADYFMFHPIYDWSYRDVWKAIYDNDWRYNTMYDAQFRYGVPIRAMRVSNYHHVQALGSLGYLQEAEPETWEAATRRLAGVNAHGHTGGGSSMIDGLPYMFSSWEEYLLYLIDNLFTTDERREPFLKLYRSTCKTLPHIDKETIAQRIVPGVVSNDMNGKKIEAWVNDQRTKAKQARERATEKEKIA
jgi:predicted phosphoadenosine phosphosulfate sulfurtransferase